jgi:hypothetical protein
MKTLDVSTMESVRGGDDTFLLCVALGVAMIFGPNEGVTEAAAAYNALGCTVFG